MAAALIAAVCATSTTSKAPTFDQLSAINCDNTNPKKVMSKKREYETHDYHVSDCINVCQCDIDAVPGGRSQNLLCRDVMGNRREEWEETCGNTAANCRCAY